MVTRGFERVIEAFKETCAVMVDVADFAVHDFFGTNDFAAKSLPDALLSKSCLLYTSPSPRDKRQSRMPSSA